MASDGGYSLLQQASSPIHRALAKGRVRPHGLAPPSHERSSEARSRSRRSGL